MYSGLSRGKEKAKEKKEKKEREKIKGATTDTPTPTQFYPVIPSWARLRWLLSSHSLAASAFVAK
jgi:hypothetical protein